MRLIRSGDIARERPGVIINEKYYDVSVYFRDYDETFFENRGLEQLEEIIRVHGDKLPELPAGVRLGPPIARPSKIVCIGLNYRDHALETHSAIPAEPILFFKSTTALCGPNDDLVLPRGSQKTDWEVELAVIIGQKASYVRKEDAPDYVAGYSLINDYSERAFQKEMGGQFCKGKGCDTFAPMGPFLLTRDEIGDVQQLKMQLSVNGRLFQDGSTADMIFDVPFLVSYISRFMTLLPGDVICTGTPAGVGAGVRPAPVFLRKGDMVEMSIERLGSSCQKVVEN